MTEFLARLSPSFNFAMENVLRLGDFFRKMADAIPENADAQLVKVRFTFCALRLKAENRSDCEKILLEAWSRGCPDEKDKPKINCVPFAEGDTGKLMSDIYSGYYGADSYIDLVTELNLSIPILEKNGALKALRMQSYLMAIDSGNGFTTLLSSFGDFLRRMGSYGDKGENKKRYVEFTVAKETEGDKVGTDDLIEKLLDGFHDDCNVVGMDLSWFLDGDKFDELRGFVRRLYRFQDQIVFVFRVPFLEKKALDRIRDVLDDVMLLRVVQIPPLHDSVLAELFWDKLREMGFVLDKALLDVFFAKVLKEKQDGRFYGFKTVEKIVGEMTLKKAALDADKCARGLESDPEVFAPDDLPADFAKIKDTKNGYDELKELIGMEKTADRVREIVSQVKLALKNDRLDKPCIHMRFLGAPGTGKTTVARIIGQIFREEGILRKGAFLEYSARSLCAEYVGQTAVRTASICRDAYGSVLFIDEAYALYENDYQFNDYGKEALTTLISEMENHRDDMLVIMAGYTDDMETLMRGNAGLRSRMPYAITFPNYSREQLFDIFMLMVRKHFDFTPELENEARSYFQNLSEKYVTSKEFANARFVRNLYERTWSKGALRASLAGLSSIELTKEDFIAASGEKEFSEKLNSKARVGF